MDVAEEGRVDWSTVTSLDKCKTISRLTKTGKPRSELIAIDEISVRQGHASRSVISDLCDGRTIWFGGEDRSEASMRQFYDRVAPRKSTLIPLAVIGSRKPFLSLTQVLVPQAAILFDEIHIMRYMVEALDAVHKAQYRRLSDTLRRYIRGRKYILLSRRESL